MTNHPGHLTRDLNIELGRKKRSGGAVSRGRAAADPAVDDEAIEAIRRAQPATTEEARARAVELVRMQSGDGGRAVQRTSRRLDAPPKYAVGPRAYKRGELITDRNVLWRARSATSQPPGGPDWELVWVGSR